MDSIESQYRINRESRESSEGQERSPERQKRDNGVNYIKTGSVESPNGVIKRQWSGNGKAMENQYRKETESKDRVNRRKVSQAKVKLLERTECH